MLACRSPRLKLDLSLQGVGKSSMILDAMVASRSYKQALLVESCRAHVAIADQADGCAMLEAHEDPEVVRLRLGKALDFEYNEVGQSTMWSPNF